MNNRIPMFKPGTGAQVYVLNKPSNTYPTPIENQVQVMPLNWAIAEENGEVQKEHPIFKTNADGVQAMPLTSEWEDLQEDATPQMNASTPSILPLPNEWE